MPKHTVYTVITPLPAHITRHNVVSFLHDHITMIDLNPLVEARRVMERPPAKASPEEYAHATWYELVDKVPFIPGLYSGKVVYHVCFHNLPAGLQTHCYAPLGLDIKERWFVGGFEPGEIRTPQELGLGIPKDGGLYLREDIDMRVNALLTSFVRKNLDNAHKTLVDRLVAKAEKEELTRYNQRLMTTSAGTSLVGAEPSVVTSGSMSHDRQATHSPVSDAWPLPNDTPALQSLPSATEMPTTILRHQPAQAPQAYFNRPTSPLPVHPAIRERNSPPLPSRSPSRVLSIAATTPQRAGRASSETARLPMMPELTRSASESSLRMRRLRTQSAASNAATIKAEEYGTSRSPTPTALPLFEMAQKVSANSSATRSTVAASSPSTSTTSTIASSVSTLPTPMSMHEDIDGDSSPTLGNLHGPFGKSRDITPSTSHPLSTSHTYHPSQPQDQRPEQHHFAAQLLDKPGPWDSVSPTNGVVTATYDGPPQNGWVRPKDIGVAVDGSEVGGMPTLWEDKERERDRMSGQLAAAPAPSVLKSKESFGGLPLREIA